MFASRRSRIRLLAIAIATTILAIALVTNDRFLRYASRENPDSRVNWIFQSVPTHFDIAVLGSSLSKEGIDPILLEASTNQKVVQLAWGGRGVSEQALYWELFLSQHSCSILLLELHPRGLEADVLAHPLDEFRYIARLDNPIVRRHLSRHCGALKTHVWRWVPMWAMAEFSTQIGWHDLLAIRKGNIFDPNAPADNRHQGIEEQMRRSREKKKRNPGASDISGESLEQFREILALCKKKGIQVIAVYPPMFLGSETEKDTDAIAWYQKLLGNGITILKPGNATYMHDASNFQDAFHLSYQGSQKYSELLAKHLHDYLTD